MTAQHEMRPVIRRAILSEIDLYQFLRGRRPFASRFAAWSLARGAVADKAAAARRLRVHLQSLISSYRNLRVPS